MSESIAAKTRQNPILRMTLATFVCVALVLSVAVTLTGSKADAASIRIRVATYNICAQYCPGLASFSTRSSQIVSAVEAYDPDVFFVQEAGRASYEVKTLRSKLRNYTMIKGSNARYIFMRKSTMTTYSVTGSKLSSGVTTVRATSRSKLQYVPYHLLRRKNSRFYLLAVNLHLTALDGPGSDSAREAEMKQIWSKMSTRERAYPTVFGGDLNSLSRNPNNIVNCDSDIYRSRVSAFLRARGYEDAVFKTTVGTSRSANTYNPSRSDTRNFCTYFQLDHLFTGNRVRIGNFIVVRHSSYSDHNMIVADLYRS